MCSIWERLRSSCPSRLPPTPGATIREKCTETPSGAISAISHSIVGLPGGMRKPIRARHPFMRALARLRHQRGLAHHRHNAERGDAVALLAHHAEAEAVEGEALADVGDRARFVDDEAGDGGGLGVRQV